MFAVLVLVLVLRMLVLTFGPTMSAEEAAQVWGCSTWTVRQRTKDGTLPVVPLRLGRLQRWPTAAVLASVGLRYDPQTGSATAQFEDEAAPAGNPGVITELVARPRDAKKAGIDAG
jgi:predicted DNA-binding transcriptional regulator AlpA